MKKLLKTLFMAFAAMSLAGCSLQDLMFWKKSSEPEQQQKEEKPAEEQKPSEGGEEKPSEGGEEEALPVLQSISISGQFKTEYLVGEEFDKSGIVVTANYDKGGSKDVSSEASFSGFDSSVAGPCIVTVSFGGKSAEISLTISESAPEQAEFPVKDVIAFFDEAGLDVVVTSYSSANLEVEYEVDDSYPGYFDVYVTGSSHEEMVAYKDALILDGWVVVGEEDGDFRLQFGETNAFVDLIDCTDYLWISFFVKEESVIRTAEEVAGDINAVFNPLVGGDILDWYEDYGCYIGGLNFGAAEATTDEEHITELQNAAGTVYYYLPEYLELVAAEYEESDDDFYVGLQCAYVGVDIYAYINGSGNVIAQVQVYDLSI